MSLRGHPKLYGPDGHLLEYIAATKSEQDKALDYLRLQARAAFKGSESTRLNASWSASNEAINTILNRELKTLRARSRWLEHNNPYMIAAINQLVHYCVGTGFDLQMAAVRMVQQADGSWLAEEMDAWNDWVEDVFREWAEDVNINAARSAPDTFADVQAILARRVAVDGEVLIHMVFDKANGSVPLYLEMIDADNLDCTANEAPGSGNPIMCGVEVDKTSWRPVAYWVYTTRGQQPARPMNANSLRIPATEMIHVYRKHFPNQLRGIPFAAGVSQAFYDLGEYTQAQIIRNKMAACFGVLLKNSTGGSALLDSGASDESDTDGFPTDAEGNVLANVAPGLFGKLPQDVEPFLVSPTAPENTYAPFLEAQLQAIGAGMEVGFSYTSLTRDTRNTTFSGGRQAENMDFQGYRPFMRWFSAKALSPVFRRWMDLAVLSGAVAAPGYDIDPRRWQRHVWMPPGWNRGINPLQEVNAATASMQNYLTTLADECAWIGKDWKTQLRMAAKIRRMQEQLGLPDPTAKTAAPAPAEMPDMMDEEEDVPKETANASK